jgi:hypothetical protein
MPMTGISMSGRDGAAALRAVAAERRRGLRRQPDVAHDRHAGADDRARPRDRHRPAALELDRVAARLLDEAQRAADGLLVGRLVGAERQVADEQRGAQPAPHGLRQDEHLVELDGDRRGVAEDGHRARVADEHDVDAGRLGGARAREVVGGHHDDRLAEALHVGQPRQRDRQALGGRGDQRDLAGVGGHG